MAAQKPEKRAGKEAMYKSKGRSSRDSVDDGSGADAGPELGPGLADDNDADPAVGRGRARRQRGDEVLEDLGRIAMASGPKVARLEAAKKVALRRSASPEAAWTHSVMVEEREPDRLSD